MKLSICIPVFNFDVRELVYGLKKEISKNHLDAEIILIDDASDESFRQINGELRNQVEQFILLTENLGRSRIRNLFLNYSSSEFLLFLDCDVKLQSSDFLKKYTDEINQQDGVEVVYGGFRIDPEYSGTLRNTYSVEREIFYGERTSDFSVFKTVNFIIKRETFRAFPFDEKITGYGYEDYIFAKKMEHGTVHFSAVNNPVIHWDNTENEVFLAKTEAAMQSLFQLSQNPENLLLIHHVKVYRLAQKIKSKHLKPLFMFLYGLFRDTVKNNLLSEKPNIRYLDLYKLHLLLKMMKL